MSMAGRSRRDPAPLGQGWELPFVVISVAVIGLALAGLAGMGAAAALAGGGWVWPGGAQQMMHALGALLAGHPGSGLPAPQAARLPRPGWVYAGVGIGETIFVALVITAVVIAGRHWRPDARGGMATHAQAAQTLGVGQLRGVKSIIRPDLYPRRNGGTRS